MVRIADTTPTTIAAVRMPMFVLVRMSVVTTGQMDVMLSEYKGQDDVDDHANEGDQAHQFPIDIQIVIHVGLLLSNPTNYKGPQTSDALHQEEYRHDRQRGHGKQGRQRLGPLVSEGEVGAGGEAGQMRRGDGHDEGRQVGEEVGGIGQDGKRPGEEAADHLDEEEGAAQEGGDLEAAEDEGALVRVGGGGAVIVVTAVPIGGGVIGVVLRAAAAILGGVAAAVLAMAMAMAMVVAVRVAAHLSRDCQSKWVVS
mmetsp:Transcript_1778/g.5193  ORF Transcript_1778/g.5193 Transcript_1778/m.5193 type:complete len:254 (+) Transcript_1778:845-1606(+)